jgi:hypothetical protein
MPTKKQGINLLDPINPPMDLWTSVYNWVFKVGRYLLVGIEVLLLGVFFTRFVVDETNNNLTKKINDKVAVLSNTEFRSQEVNFKNLSSLFLDINELQAKQVINSSLISEIVSSIPSELTVRSFGFGNNRVSLSVLATDLTVVKNYEFSLRQNPQYSNVVITISKSGASGSTLSVTISFNIKEE